MWPAWRKTTRSGDLTPMLKTLARRQFYNKIITTEAVINKATNERQCYPMQCCAKIGKDNNVFEV